MGAVQRDGPSKGCTIEGTVVDQAACCQKLLVILFTAVELSTVRTRRVGYGIRCLSMKYFLK